MPRLWPRPIAVAVLTVTLTACTQHADPKPAATTTTPRTYSRADCEALLEKTYQERQLRDASNDPECKALTHDQYVKAVGAVLATHKDEILDRAANKADWDEAWESTAPAQQDVVCRRLKEDGAITVGQEMAEASGSDSTGNEVEMSQYFLTEKCGRP
ncbi:hypothetical protein [Streptomyces decoyicus]|uniref:hypothetical protein n=1 Tax=Streptomyces decoyicus TaxID=249567 RepID=UPI0033B99435